jgi:(S)-ureidoglycine aminohydrolase
MHNIGYTRSSYQRTHLLQTPDTFVRTKLPGMSKTAAVIHAAPQIGAGFMQYTAEFETGGSLGSNAAQRFVFVLQGTLEFRLGASNHALEQGSYVHLPDNVEHTFVAHTDSRAVFIEKPYTGLPGVGLGMQIGGNIGDLTSRALMGDEDLQVQFLLPEQPQYDYAVNVMTYQPGASLPMVEVHVMEHGLLMLEGEGIYRLGDSWYPVKAGDFIWMAPFCPQWFGALGKVPAKYLIYKDSARDPFARS